MPVGTDDHDVIIIGGGHNALVASAYLSRAGLDVLVLEARSVLGGAAESAQIFPGVDARLSRFAYLVSLLPQSLVSELELDLDLRSRRVASYTPFGKGGLLVERDPGPATRRSFHALTGGDAEWQRWRKLEAELAAMARLIAPTLTEPLPRAATLSAQLDSDLWRALTDRPLGELLESALTDDTVRGVVLTDALIGTFTAAHDPTLRQNRCFLYHVIGNGTGEWKVPVGGMGAVAAELERAARRSGAALRTGVPVTAIDPEPEGVRVRLGDGSWLRASYLLAGCAPATLSALLGERAVRPEGSQTKINLVLQRLPELKSGLDPRDAFAGTLHLHQGYRRLEAAYAEAASGRIPDPMPCEVYCHTLTDPSILSPRLRASGWHTLTLFALHTPARLFADDPERAREQAKRAALASLQSVIREPLENCVARDVNKNLCIEVMSPLDIEREVAMPGGHIFHGDLAWPWLGDGAAVRTSAERWGVATQHSRILLCGSGAVRGGAVSGLGGHNAAMALLESR
ncbi:MAG: hypothetical protein QOE64_2218 [Frankiales bacterium]|nr:hypothetical protein [Frankiales bacterium]